MFIIKMIMRITNFNQTELAEFLGVSRASVNCWINSEFEISTYQKNIISKKFNIPVDYFDYDLVHNKDLAKKVYQLLLKNWRIMNEGNIEEDEQEALLNEIEFELNKDEKIKLKDSEILDALINNYNPYTGEILEENFLLNDIQVKEFLKKIRNKYYKYGTTNIDVDDLTEQERIKFENLRIWRKEKMQEEGFFSAYIVFTNKELINIVTANVKDKEDLLNIKGIGKTKYEKYGEEIYEIIKGEDLNYV